MKIIKGRIPNLCQLQELNLSCFGCCGHGFSDKSTLKRDIKINTERYNRNRNDILHLIDNSQDLRSSGICKFIIILKDKNIGCPLHPSLNYGADLRENHCDANFICTTKKEFDSWNDRIRSEFIDYIKTKQLDIVDYSLKNSKGSLLGGFKRKK